MDERCNPINTTIYGFTLVFCLRRKNERNGSETTTTNAVVQCNSFHFASVSVDRLAIFGQSHVENNAQIHSICNNKWFSARFFLLARLELRRRESRVMQSVDLEQMKMKISQPASESDVQIYMMAGYFP